MEMARPRSLLISVEGIDGAGKTTQAGHLADWLESLGWPVVRTREPGGTDLGQSLRSLILRPEAKAVPAPVTELLLYMADRAQHLHEVIRPALARGTIVVADRFIDSTLAYQGVARGFGIDRLIELHAALNLLIWPDCTVLLDLAPEEGLRRKRGILGEWSRFEAEDLAFHRAVAEGYRELWKRFPERMVVISAEGDPDTVAAAVQMALLQRYPWLQRSSASS